MDKSVSFAKLLGQRDVLALAFGSMIGFGWVVLAGDWLLQAGTLGAVLGFLVGGLLVLTVGLTYAELVAAMPKVGGEHVYVWRAMGYRWAFVASWGMALGYVSVVAFEAVALPTTLEYLLPGYKVGYLWTVAGYDVYASWAAVGVLGSLLITWLNYRGVRMAAVFQAAVVLFLLAVGALMLLGVSVGGSSANFQPLWDNGLRGVLAVVLMTPFLFVGFDVIPQSAEEIDLPHRHIGRLLIISIFMALAWYVLVILTVGKGLGREALASTPLAAADAMTALLGGRFWGNVLILGGVAGIVTSWNGFMVGASRLLYAMAESGMLPVWLGRLHPRYRTPANAVLVVGALSLVAPLFGRSTLVWLVDAGGLNIVVAYLLVSAAFLLLRRREPEMPRPFRVWRGAWVGAAAVLMSLLIAVQYLPGMPAGLTWPFEWVIVGSWWAVGLFFLARLKVQAFAPEAELSAQRV